MFTIDPTFVIYTLSLAYCEPSPMSLLPTLEASPVSEVVPPETQKDEDASVLVTPVTPKSYHNEPVVTRRELWSYYCVYH
jgi:hypothetical protein